jgi:uncharacterized protein YggU (UPF0235/DUF167 family)
MYIKVVVKTQMKKESLIQKSNDHFEFSVKEKAENNMANKRIIEIIAIFFGVSKGKVRIINGHHHPHKLLVVDENMI